MKDQLTDEQVNTMLQALDEALESGPWDKTNFLRVIGKNLREIRDNFANHAGKGKTLGNFEKIKAFKPQREPRIGEIEIFISLYSTEGNSIQAWERILANLPRHIISRPIYNNEEAVRSFIKSKENKTYEAYVSIYINEADILPIPAEKTPVDKFGKPLLTLKHRSLSVENINRFEHLSGSYDYIKGRLVKKSSTDSD